LLLEESERSRTRYTSADQEIQHAIHWNLLAGRLTTGSVPCMITEGIGERPGNFSDLLEPA
jgi:hypothetical protein